jgi:F0F1-type ATP synthase membrane subunit c/vacuolar-type H+-ATPase subunit K
MDEQYANKHFLTMRFIHLAMVVGVIIYGFVLWFTHYNTPMQALSNDDELQGMAKMGIIVYAVILFFVVSAFKKYFFSAQSINSIKGEQKKDANAPLYYGKYLTILFILWAMVETLPIFGIIYYFMFTDLEYALLIIGLSVVFMLCYRPRRDELSILENIYRENNTPSEYEKL